LIVGVTIKIWLGPFFTIIYSDFMIVATIFFSQCNNGDKSELPNPTIYAPETCPTDSERNHRTFVAEQLSAQTVYSISLTIFSRSRISLFSVMLTFFQRCIDND